VEMHMFVQTRAKAVDKSHSADVQGGFVHLRCTRALGG
jgi:hypothetical protein